MLITIQELREMDCPQEFLGQLHYLVSPSEQIVNPAQIGCNMPLEFWLWLAENHDSVTKADLCDAVLAMTYFQVTGTGALVNQFTGNDHGHP